ncbi:MAG: UDP-glucose 4-epimerase GalE [Anaerolineales bacterium]|nr:UDP-glucose 4-epimerase GalE [Anaerolineales bacterium]
MRVLVTGGAGYIGSQMVRQLIENKIQVVVADSLENGHRAAVSANVSLRVGDIGDEKFLNDVFTRDRFDAVIHFAGYIAVGESVVNPIKYFCNNVEKTIRLLDTMLKANVTRLVFSSSAAVYGIPTQVPIPDDHPKQPINPYGESKLVVEKMLQWLNAATPLRAISLRYFNACGATLDGKFGEDHPDEGHIIPLALRAARTGKPFLLFGDDYNTRDGTCIRDYIHVIDLCDAHLRALDALTRGHKTDAYNVGTGRGFSNREIAESVRRGTGIDFEIQFAPRRPGDPDELVADSSRLQKELGWQPRYSDLETIVGSAWQWHKQHPNGYGDKLSGQPSAVSGRAQ